MPLPDRKSDALFMTTRWSVVLSARDESDDGAMEALCRTCWRTLYVLARRFGHSPPDAGDLRGRLTVAVPRARLLRWSLAEARKQLVTVGLEW